MSVVPDYWVATAGIAPVLALAHVVNIGRYLYWQDTVLDSIKKRLRSDSADPKTPDEPSAAAWQFQKRAMRASNTVGVAIWASIVAVIACGTVLVQALASLRNNDGSKGLSLAVLVELTVSLAVLVLSAGAEGVARLIARNANADLTLPG